MSDFFQQSDELRYPGRNTEGMIRAGLVSAVDADTARVRVTFPDRQGVVSGWLPVLQWLTGASAQSYALPDPGEYVGCLFFGTGLEAGFCMRGFYTADNPPPVSGNVVYLQFGSDAVIIYHKDTKEMHIATGGKVTIAAAAGVEITANVTITGNATITGTLTAAGVDMNTHTHYIAGTPGRSGGPGNV